MLRVVTVVLQSPQSSRIFKNLSARAWEDSGAHGSARGAWRRDWLRPLPSCTPMIRSLVNCGRVPMPPWVRIGPRSDFLSHITVFPFEQFVFFQCFSDPRAYLHGLIKQPGVTRLVLGWDREAWGPLDFGNLQCLQSFKRSDIKDALTSLDL